MKEVNDSENDQFEKTLIPGLRDKMLDREELKNITFDQFALGSIYSSHFMGDCWHWPKSSYVDVERYAYYLLMNFCGEIKSITIRQLMMREMFDNKHLVNFLGGRNKYDDYMMTIRLYAYAKKAEMTVGFVNELILQLKDIQKESSLYVFKEAIEKIQNSELFISGREFFDLFKRPYIISGEIRHNDSTKDLENFDFKNTSNHDREKILYEHFTFSNIQCFAESDGKLIPFSETSFIKNSEEKISREIGLSRKILMDMFNISIHELLLEFNPKPLQPLNFRLRIYPSGSLFLLVTDPRSDLIERRTNLQKRIIGKEFSIKQKNKKHHDNIRERLFFKLCERFQSDANELGFILRDLRYLALIVYRFNEQKKRTPVVFPYIIPTEEDASNIIKLKNPTLVVDWPRVRVIGNDVVMTNQARVHVITGPNQNGKSRYVDSVGLSQIMFQAGWPIFAEKASMSPKTDIRIHYVESGVGIIGDSRFSYECVRMRKFFENIEGQYPLLLIDEPFTGTNIKDAEVLLKEIIEVCIEKNKTMFLTTHYHGLIPFVESTKNARNLHCVVGESGEFTFKIEPGASTYSNALVVAEKAGARKNWLIKLLSGEMWPVPVSSSDTLPF